MDNTHTKDTGSIIGLALGKKVTGVCVLSPGNDMETLTSVPTAELSAFLELMEEESGAPREVVVDAPLGNTSSLNFRSFEQVFLQGLFSNRHVGIQPNTPGGEGLKLGPLKKWLYNNRIEISNEFPAQAGVARETYPSLVLGLLLEPGALQNHKNTLRFRYGRGKYLAPISVAFDLLARDAARGATGHPFFAPVLGDKPPSWEWIEATSNTSFEEKASAQGDVLLSALTCALVGLHDLNGQGCALGDDEGHYLLPPLEHMHEGWKRELARLLKGPDFGKVRHPFAES